MKKICCYFLFYFLAVCCLWSLLGLADVMTDWAGFIADHINAFGAVSLYTALGFMVLLYISPAVIVYWGRFGPRGRNYIRRVLKLFGIWLIMFFVSAAIVSARERYLFAQYEGGSIGPGDGFAAYYWDTAVCYSVVGAVSVSVFAGLWKYYWRPNNGVNEVGPA